MTGGCFAFRPIDPLPVVLLARVLVVRAWDVIVVRHALDVNDQVTEVIDAHCRGYLIFCVTSKTGSVTANSVTPWPREISVRTRDPVVALITVDKEANTRRARVYTTCLRGTLLEEIGGSRQIQNRIIFRVPISSIRTRAPPPIALVVARARAPARATAGSDVASILVTTHLARLKTFRGTAARRRDGAFVDDTRKVGLLQPPDVIRVDTTTDLFAVEDACPLAEPEVALFALLSHGSTGELDRSRLHPATVAESLCSVLIAAVYPRRERRWRLDVAHVDVVERGPLGQDGFHCSRDSSGAPRGISSHFSYRSGLRRIHGVRELTVGIATRNWDPSCEGQVGLIGEHGRNRPDLEPRIEISEPCFRCAQRGERLLAAIRRPDLASDCRGHHENQDEHDHAPAHREDHCGTSLTRRRVRSVTAGSRCRLESGHRRFTNSIVWRTCASGRFGSPMATTRYARTWSLSESRTGPEPVGVTSEGSQAFGSHAQ